MAGRKRQGEKWGEHVRNEKGGKMEKWRRERQINGMRREVNSCLLG